MHIRELMTVRPRTVKAGDTIVDAAKLMRGEDAGIAPVVDGRRLIGVITDRDIAVRVIASEKDPATTHVEEIASENLVTIDPDQDLAEALRLMTQHHIRQLPVVEEDGTLIGMVRHDDVVRLAERPQLETISE
ncbi:MAG TPA: CBS domain-containing protein [Gaiellaceae bacterium]|jgi:CBS domain-containing protein|nr:CBS domain-containing protein [Gaiellaceae bacterium]